MSQDCVGSSTSSHSFLSSPPSTPPICLALLMGLPASGKSTLASFIVQEYNKSATPTVAIKITYDDFVPHEVQARCAVAAKGEDKDKVEEESLTKSLRKGFLQSIKYISESIQSLMDKQDSAEQELSEALSKLSLIQDEVEVDFLSPAKKILDELKESHWNSVILLIDDNNYYVSMRSDFYNLAKHLCLGFCILYCKTSLKTCRQRNSERQERFRVPDESIVEMSLKLEEPKPMVNPFDAYSIQITEPEGKGETCNVPLIIQVLDNALKNPVVWTPPLDRTEEIEQQRRICSQNEVHQADQFMRKWINKELGIASVSKGKGPQNVKELAKGLNLKRVMVLDMLRSGEYKIAAKVGLDLEFRNEVINLMSSVEPG